MPVPVSPYMQFVAPVRRPDRFPAIVHTDGTARVQTLRASQNPVSTDCSRSSTLGRAARCC